MVKIESKGKKILVRQYSSKTVSKGGIILPGKSGEDIKDYSNWLAEVVSLGGSVKDFIELSVGDCVMMDPSYVPVMFEDPNIEDGEKLLMAFVNPEQILSTIIVTN